MNLEGVHSLMDILWKIGGVIASLSIMLWGVNKMWLSSIYQTKRDSETALKSLQKEMHQSNDDARKTRAAQDEKLATMESTHKVFEATYKGDMALLKSQISGIVESNREVRKDNATILHKVNNISNWDIEKMVKHIIENK